MSKNIRMMIVIALAVLSLGCIVGTLCMWGGGTFIEGMALAGIAVTITVLIVLITRLAVNWVERGD